MRKIISIVLTAAVVIMAVPPAAALPKADTFAVTVENRASPSPKEAVRRFLEAVKELDLEAALACCAANEYATKYDTASAYVTRKQFSPTIPAPTQYEFYRAINQASMVSSFASQLKLLIYSLSPSEAVVDALESLQYTFQGEPQFEAKAFVYAVNPIVVEELTVVSIDVPHPDEIDRFNQTQGGQKETQVTMKIYGCEELAERVALFTVGEAYYYCGFSLMRYEKGWKIHKLHSRFADISSANKFAQKTTPEEYAALISTQSS